MLLNLALYLLFTSPFPSEAAPSIKKLPPTEMTQIGSLWLIALHQNFLTHIDGPRSHFTPCSSTYMKEAILKYGFFKGSLLGLNRLLQENKDPWVYPKVFYEDRWIKQDLVP